MTLLICALAIIAILALFIAWFGIPSKQHTSQRHWIVKRH
jgi:hypothetical protein